MAIYNLGVQYYEYYDARTQVWTRTSNLEKAIEYFVTKDMYNYIDSYFKDKRPFLINEVGNKTIITFMSGAGPGHSAIGIRKTEYYIYDPDFFIKFITERSFSDGQPTEYFEADLIEGIGGNRFLDFNITIKNEWCEKIPKEVPIYKPDFDWKSWATKEKLKLENYGKGKEYLFFDTSDKSKILGKGAILGASIGFTVNSTKYTLDDIINGNLNGSTLGATFKAGMSFCNGIIIKYGGFLGPILRNKVFKIILGAITPEFIGTVWVTYEIISLIDRYVPDGSSNWDKLQQQFKDMGYAVSGTGGMLTLGYTTTGQQIVDNWANSSYTGAGGATATGSSETGADIMEGINDIAGAIKNGLKAQGQSIVDVLKNLDISLTIPQGASVPLTFDTVALKTFFDTLKVPFDTLSLQEIIATGMGFDTTALKEYFDTLKVPFDTLSLAEIFASGLGLKIPEGLTLPISGLRDLTITGLRDLAITGLRDLAVTGEVALSGLRDINVTGIKDIVCTGINDIVATIENPVLSLAEESIDGIKAIGDVLSQAHEVELARQEREIAEAERSKAKFDSLFGSDGVVQKINQKVLGDTVADWTDSQGIVHKIPRTVVGVLTHAHALMKNIESYSSKAAENEIDAKIGEKEETENDFGLEDLFFQWNLPVEDIEVDDITKSFTDLIGILQGVKHE